MVRNLMLLVVAAFILAACGSPIEEKSKDNRAAQEANTAKAMNEAGE
jgi:uncharacterized protein YcfL